MERLRLRYSEDLIRRAVRAFWWRSTGWSFFGAMALVAVLCARALLHGDRSWWVGAAGVVLLIGVAVCATLYLVHRRSSLARLRRMGAPEAVLELGDERFRFSSDVGTTELRWDAVTEVWRFPEFWLLFFSQAHWVTLPTADLSDEARAHILARVRKQR